MKVQDLIPQISQPLYEDMKNKNHHSALLREEGLTVLVIRGLNINDDGLLFDSSCFIFVGKNVYKYNYEEDVVEVIEGSYAKFHEMMEQIYDFNQKVIDGYINEIDKIEDSMFERSPSRIFVDIWFDLKKDLTRIERHLQRKLGVIKDFIRLHVNESENCDIEFNKVSDTVQINLSNVSIQLARLDNLHHYHNSIKQDKLNKNIYMLTLVSAIFLPLNLVVGFFGMNTENLFFKSDATGTLKVLVILGMIFLVAIFGLPFIRFVDNHILKFFLGRYDIYKKMSTKLEKLLKFD